MQVEKPNERDKLWELQNVISKLPLNVCCTAVLPEFGLRWSEVGRAVRNYRLPMESGSVARVLCRFLARSLPAAELDGILARLRLQLAARQPRTWHVVRLHGARGAPPALHDVPAAIHLAPPAEVNSLMVDSLLYLSIHATSKQSTLYVASAGADAVALVSTLAAKKLIQAAVEGLGYTSYSAANLHGHHIPSLLRVSSPGWGAAPARLAGAEPYAPAPLVRPHAVDYTNQEYDLQYVDHILGPEPPLLTSLTIRANRQFFDRSLLNKSINMRLSVRSENIAVTLRSWVAKGAIAANSELFDVFHTMKSNTLTLADDDDDDDVSE